MQRKVGHSQLLVEAIVAGANDRALPSNWHYLRRSSRVCSSCLELLWLFVIFVCLHGQDVHAFTIGDIAQANGLVWVRQTAGGTYIGTQASGTQGTVTGGPTISQIGGTGSYYTWYNINWPSAPDGWVADVGLVQAVLAAPTLTSIVQKCDATTSGIEIQWSTVTGASNYEIYRNGVLIYTTTTAGTVFWNTVGLTPGLSYIFQVKAKNGSATSGFSNSLSTTAPNCTVFGAPTLTSIIQKCDGTTSGIEIQWSAVTGASNYEIYRNGVLIYTTTTAGTVFGNNVGLTSGVSYSFQVKAKNGSATSGFSNSLSTTAPNCTVGVPTVQTLAATSVATSSATFNGQVVSDGSSSILERRIEWVKNTGTWGAGVTNVDFGVVNNANINVSGSTFSHSKSGLLANTAYKYRVWAHNSVGWSDVNQVNVVTFTTSSGQSAPTVQTLTASPVTANSARLNATVNPNGANTSFHFEYGTTTAYGDVTASGNTSVSLSINFDLTGLAPNTAYHYRIVASSSGGTSYGEDVQFNTAAQTGPTLSLTAPNGGETWTAGTTRTVIWSASGATSQISYYYGDYSLDGGASWFNSIFFAYPPTTTANWSIPASAVSSQARIRIRVFNSSGVMIASTASANTFTIISGAANPTAVPDASNLGPVSGERVYFSGARSSGGGSGCAINSYSWNFGDNTTGTGSNPSHVYTSASGSTTYTVWLTVTDCNSLIASNYVLIRVTGMALGNSQQQQAFSPDPVNLATGNYIYDHVDLRFPGRGMPFEFKRFYNSKDTTGSGLPLGYGWTHSYNINLSINASNSAVITYGDGHRETYPTNGTGGYLGEPGVFNTLTNSGGTFVLTTKEQQKFNFDLQGRLTSIADKNSNTITLTYSGTSLSAITNTVGRSINFSNDVNGCLVQITDPLGRAVRFTYDASTNLVSVSDLRSNLTQFAYDEYHQITNAIDPRGNTFVSMVYDQQRRVVSSQKDALLNPTTFEYDFVNRVTTVTDAYTNKSYSHYDDRLRVIMTVDNLGNTENFEYDTNNNRITLVDKLGYVTRYAYDTRGNVTLKTDALTNSTSITYDLKNNPTNRIDALGGVTIFRYDANGSLTNTLNALGKTNSVKYDAFGQPLVLTNPNGKATTNTFDASGNLIKVQNSLGGSNVFTFDVVGRKLTQRDALARTNRFVYDSTDNLVAFVNALGKTNSFTYDSNNNRVTATDFLGYTTTNVYDQKDRLIIVRNPLGGSITNEYDKLDRKVRVWDARGGLTQLGYDAVGNLVAITNATLEITRYTYDANGNRTSITTPMGNMTTNYYDALNRLVASSDALGNSTVSVFDPLGRRIQLIDPLNRTSYSDYDSLGRLVQFTDAAGGRVTNAYDNIGNRIASTDTKNNTTAYTFDALNRLVSTLEPAGGLSQYTYDAVGNVLNRTDAKNQITTYQYDANNRPTRITYPTGTPVTFGYDANGNRTNMTDSLGATTYSYDSLNRLTNVTDCYGKTVSYGYDQNGNRTSITYPGNKTVTYVYDSANRLTSVTDWLSHTTIYGYDLDGNLISTVNPNNTTASYRYGVGNRLVSLTNSGPSAAIISRYTYTLDAVGNHTQVEQFEPLPTTPVAGQFNYAYDSDNRMITWEGQWQGFDANGNMISVSVTNLFSYDYENRLTQTVLAGANSSYQYDGDGNRMAADRAGLVTRYMLDRNSPLTQVLAETDSGGTITAYYVYGLGLVSRIDAGANATFYHFDSRGSTVALTDAAGQITDSYAYDPFGTPTAASGVTDNRFRYLGRHGVVDEEDGLNYIRARYYSAGRGRFITKDPTTGKDGDSQSLNRYIYALNNPVRLIDISGLSSQETSGQTGQFVTTDSIFTHNWLISPSNGGLLTPTAGSTPSIISQSGNDGNGNNPGFIDRLAQILPGTAPCAGPEYDCSNPSNPRRADPSPANQGFLHHDLRFHNLNNLGYTWSDLEEPAVYNAHWTLARELPPESVVFKVLFGDLAATGWTMNTYMNCINAAGNWLYQTTGF